MTAAQRPRCRPFAARTAALLVAGCLSLCVDPGVTGLPVPGGAATAHAAEQTRPKTLRVAITRGIDTLNPFLAVFATSTEINRLMYDFLTAYDPKDTHPVPGLAESWEVSTDKLTWTYRIRKNAKWSDGQPVTARDVAFTYRLMLRDEDARTANGNFVANFASVTAPDDWTAVFRTKTPQATMLALDVPIVPEHVWKNVKDIGDYQNDQYPVVGSGPFILVDYKPDQYVKLKANKNFWRGAPKLDELVYRYYKNTDAAVQALRKGEVDVVGGLTPAQYDALKGEPGIALNKAQGSRFYELAINPGAATVTGEPIGDGHPALRDQRVRRAIHHAIDKKTLVQKVLGGYGEPGAGYLPARFKDFHWAPNPAEAIDFDIAKANQILDQAGYRRGPDGVRTMPEGSQPLKFRLLGHNDRPLDAPLAQHIAGWLERIGIRADVRLLASARLNEVWSAGEYDLALGGWNANPDPDYVLSIQKCDQRPAASGKGGTTDNFLCDAEYEALYAQQIQELDRAKRAEIVKRMQQRLYELSTAVILYYAYELEAYRKDRFAPFQTQPDPGGVILHQDGYWSMWSATPVSAERSSGGTGPLLGGLAGLAVLAVMAGVVVNRRRRATADDRE
ncbi:ABC transporter substrate-binding protein [Carbonactinospora thermoautotrophica]|uniref:ABC transporter substrate-binding protein n=1 Tax=Carbonactinospora thermoautotrophica TaxID=1469144 RepID=UPI0008316C7E|nr:ABC transporter substrate-binding protein [Carbonactinospora thermoautotrophica]